MYLYPDILNAMQAHLPVCYASLCTKSIPIIFISIGMIFCTFGEMDTLYFVENSTLSNSLTSFIKLF